MPEVFILQWCTTDTCMSWGEKTFLPPPTALRAIATASNTLPLTPTVLSVLGITRVIQQTTALHFLQGLFSRATGSKQLLTIASYTLQEASLLYLAMIVPAGLLEYVTEPSTL